MVNWVANLNDRLFQPQHGPFDPSYNPATQVVVGFEEEDQPDRRLHRYDAALKKRAATAQEIADYDAAQVAAREQMAFDGEKMLKAVAIWVAQKLGVPLATARSEILAIYRGLA